MSEMLRGIPFDYEPTRENRFFAEFPSELGIETWMVQEFKNPAISINKVEIPYMNGMDYVAGRMTCEEIDITFIDLIGPSTSQILMEWVRLHGEFLTGRMGYASGYKKDVILRMLDPTGVPVGLWTLEKCMIVSLDFGKSDHSSDDVKKLTLTLQPVRCIRNI